MALKDAFTFFQVNRDERAIGRLALEAFAGLRHSSAARLVRSDLDFHESGVVMAGAKHKTGRRHYVDGFPRNLWRWLRHAPADCWTLKPRAYAQHKALAFARGNVKNPGNVWRHTFATMHLAAFKDAPALGTLLTHRNLTMLYSHYKGRGVAKSTARAFFLITPKTVLLSFERFCRFAGVTPNPPTP
jgi:integrase